MTETDEAEPPEPTICPSCRQPYVADWFELPKLICTEYSEGPGWISESYVSSSETIDVLEPHRPCPNVREWTNATEGTET